MLKKINFIFLFLCLINITNFNCMQLDKSQTIYIDFICTEQEAKILTELNKHEDIVKLLIYTNKSSTFKDKDLLFNRSLICAIINENKNLVESLLSYENINLNAENENGDLPLILAINRSTAEIVKLLIDNGAKVNIKDKVGFTPLMHAIPDIDKMRLLLEHKDIKVNVQTKGGLSALVLATINLRDAPLKLLLEHKDINVNIKNLNGNTPLMIASMNNLKNSVKLLLSAKGIDVNIQNNIGQTALMLAPNWAEDLIKIFNN